MKLRLLASAPMPNGDRQVLRFGPRLHAYEGEDLGLSSAALTVITAPSVAFDVEQGALYEIDIRLLKKPAAPVMDPSKMDVRKVDIADAAVENMNPPEESFSATEEEKPKLRIVPIRPTAPMSAESGEPK